MSHWRPARGSASGAVVRCSPEAATRAAASDSTSSVFSRNAGVTYPTISFRAAPASALLPITWETKSASADLTLATPMEESSSTIVPPRLAIAARASASDAPCWYRTTYSFTRSSLLAVATVVGPARDAATSANSAPTTTRFRIETPSLAFRRARHAYPIRSGVDPPAHPGRFLARVPFLMLRNRHGPIKAGIQSNVRSAKSA